MRKDRRSFRSAVISSVSALGLLSPIAANATSISVGTINAMEDIYQVGGPDGSDGIAPTIINVTGLKSITFSVPSTDHLTLNSGSNINDADGVGSQDADSFNTGFGGLAGLTAPNDGFLAGIFVGATISSTAPAALDFSASGLTTSFASLSPKLQQAFFIGDGLTGDGTGTVQTFYVPAGATELALGISDACNYHGSPSCYYDNSGGFASISASGVTSVVSTVPLPASAPMFGAALLALAGLAYAAKRKKAAAAA